MFKYPPRKAAFLGNIISKDVLGMLIIISVYAIILLALIQRIFYGIEITDEAFYVAEGYIVTQGATPFVNMFQASGFALLNASFVWLYVSVTGSTAGIMLYFRIISLLLRLTLVLIVCLIMKPYMKAKITALWLLPFVAFVPHSIITMSYNTWALILMPLCCVLVVRSILSENHRMSFGIIGGSVFAFIILCYPLMIITGIVLLPLILAYEKFNHIGHKTLYGYLAGGLITGVVILLFFTLQSGNFYGIFEGLKIIIVDNPYNKLPKGISNESLQTFTGYMKNWILSISIAYMFINLPVLNKKQKSLLVIISVITCIFYYSYNIFIDYAQIMYTLQARHQISSVLCRLFFPIPLILLPLIEKKKKLAQALLIFIYLTSLISCFASSYFAFNGMNNRYYFLVQGTLLVIPFIYFAINDLIEVKIEKVISFLSSTLIACVFTLGFLMNYYGYLYRDEPIDQLNYKVKYGVYSGLYTTRARGEGILSLEKTIRSVTNSSDNILFMDCVPMAYLMTDAQYTAPSTWDIQLYSYGFTDDILLQKYFKTVNRTPNKIIFIFTGRDKILSIDSQNYKFNDYVKSNYELVSNITAHFPVKIYHKRKSQ
ncbi:MAG: hypothetical protein U2P59_02230 [Synergistota bacterium]|nr:hypothetical protein [Synergistota bacterium]